MFSIVSLLQTVLQLNQNTLILMCFDILVYVITTKGGLLQRVREETALCLETLCGCPVLCGHHLVIMMITIVMLVKMEVDKNMKEARKECLKLKTYQSKLEKIGDMYKS